MSGHWRITSAVSPGRRMKFIEWNEEVRAPESRRTTSSCFVCGTERAVHIAIDDIREPESDVVLYAYGVHYATRRRLWRETVTVIAHYCQPRPDVTEVSLCQFTPLGRGVTG